MIALRLQINDKTVYEGPTIAMARVGEEIHHNGRIVGVEALVWDFLGADPDRTYLDIAPTVGTQPYTF